MEPPGNNNPVYQERLLNDEEFKAFEDNDQKVILVRDSLGSGAPSSPPRLPGGPPSLFPTSGSRPNKPRTPGSFKPSSRYLARPQSGALGGRGNPGGAGGGAAEFDDQRSARTKKPQSQKTDKNKFQSDIYNSKNKKKPEAEQCSLDENTPNEINEKFDSKAVKKLIKTALENQRVKQEYEGIKKRINEGVNPIDIGKNQQTFLVIRY